MSASTSDVIVLGAGPAGLSFAASFGELGGRCAVLEAGHGAGDSWRRMPRDMKLNSGWGASALPGARVTPLNYASRVSRADYHSHLVDFGRAREIDIRPGEGVRRVSRDAGGFILETAGGSFKARVVVNATGYFAKPVVPDYPGLAASRIVQVTVPEYESADRMTERMGGGSRAVLVVGKRITAGQLALELHDAGHRVCISNRSPIEFATRIELQQLGFPFYYPYEAVRLRFGRYGGGSSALLMAGGRIANLIRNGEVRAMGPISRFAGDKVEFTDGSIEAPDGVLWATGYQPALDHMSPLVALDPMSGLPTVTESFESREVPGLYFLGLDQQRDFTSRMLRGMRRDARHLAQRLAHELGSAS
jgi:hypothetical protein